MMNKGFIVSKIVSGGQTGVDRAGLDVAIDMDFEHGGWCPRNRRAEDGKVPKKYKLTEALSVDYKVRTELNVKESDGTLILYIDKLKGGTKLTFALAKKLRKPVFTVDLNNPSEIEETLNWLADQAIETLNIAGPRESSHPGIHQSAREMLADIFAQAKLG